MGTKLDFKIIKNSSKKRVFITGASGEIATSIAKFFKTTVGFYYFNKGVIKS